jgi:CheY-specific phosphatase CheX
MTAAANKPDLRGMGEGAFIEVLKDLLSLSATPGPFPSPPVESDVPHLIASRVALDGPRVSGTVHIRLPQAFAARAVQLLTELADDSQDSTAAQTDVAAEIVNMVAGGVAARLRLNGYSCRLGTPSVSCDGSGMIQAEPGTDCGRAEIVCDGHRLEIEVHCRYLFA